MKEEFGKENKMLLLSLDWLLPAEPPILSKVQSFPNPDPDELLSLYNISSFDILSLFINL